MSLVDIVRAAATRPLTTVGGEPSPLQLGPPLSEADLEVLEAEVPAPLPDQVRELLEYTSGFTGGVLDLVDFTGQQCAFEFESAFPHGLPIAADGAGNFWVVDLLPTAPAWGPIYYASHDPPVILYQSADLAEFLTELFKLSEPPYESLVDAVQDDRPCRVWRKNPGVLEHAEALASDDAELRAFAQELRESFQIVDLRHPSVGLGFSWGRYGPDAEVERYGYLPIFAYEKKKRLLARVFGGKS